ncbi:hypothetical protein GQ473_07210 [archaeon]|nr:hypothetical protein [archaeon]
MYGDNSNNTGVNLLVIKNMSDMGLDVPPIILCVYPVNSDIKPYSTNRIPHSIVDDSKELYPIPIDYVMDVCEDIDELMIVGDYYFFKELYDSAEKIYLAALDNIMSFSKNENLEQIRSCVNVLGLLYIHTNRIDKSLDISEKYAAYFDSQFLF